MLALRSAGNVRGLTLYQPWAQAIALGLKRLETRAYKVSWRGLLLIHASAVKSGKVREAIANGPAWRHLREAGEWRNYLELPAASVVAVARLDEVLHVPTAGWSDEALAMVSRVDLNAARIERDLGDFSPGRRAWRLADVVKLERPVKCRGAQGLWFVSPDVLEQVRQAMPPEWRAQYAHVDDPHDRVAP